MKLRQRLGMWLMLGGTKANNITPDIAMGIGDNNGPNWNKWDGSKAIKDGYKSSVWVYRCINRKATQAGSVPWVVQTRRGKSGQWKDAPNHPLNALLDKPNPFYTWTEMIELIVAYLDLTGRCFWGINRSGDSIEIWPLPSHMIKVVPSKTEVISHYLYCVDGKEIPLDPKDIIYMRYADPANPIEGLSPIMAAARTIDTDVEAVDWNKNAMKNRAVPDFALTATEQMNVDQFKTFSQLLKDEYQRSHNARKAMILGNFNIQRLGMSPAEMDFIESRKMTRVEICAAVDVPPQLVGIPDAQTYANYEQAEKAFWLNCIVPLVRRIRDALNMNMINVSGPDVRLNYDLSEVPALNEDVSELHKRVGEDFKNNIIILDEARGVLGYEPHPEKGQMFYADFAPKPLPLQDPNADPNADPNLDANSGKTATSNNGKKMLELKWLNLTSEAQRASYWKAIDRQREDFTEAVEKRVRTRFQSEKNDVVSTIKSLTTTDNVMAEVEKVLLKGRSDWTKVVMSVWIAVTKEFGARTFDRLKSDAGLLHIETKESFINVFSNFIRGYITQVVGQKVVNITDTTLDQVRTNVQEAVDAGESIPEIAKRIDDLYLDDIIPKRSTVIARTEVIGASNYGSRMGAKETGLNLEKEWLETQDGNTRAAHKHMPEGVGGERKGMDEPYSNGLMYPGDPGGKAGEVIQCRCTEVYHVIE